MNFYSNSYNSELIYGILFIDDQGILNNLFTVQCYEFLKLRITTFIYEICDAVVRTDTLCTVTVRTCNSRTPGQPVIYSHESLFLQQPPILQSV
jgi:hypothetical protein